MTREGIGEVGLTLCLTWPTWQQLDEKKDFLFPDTYARTVKIKCRLSLTIRVTLSSRNTSHSSNPSGRFYLNFYGKVDL